MSKKGKKREKKQKNKATLGIPLWLGTYLTHYTEPTITVKFAYEGRVYKGIVPCVGEVEK
jgi:hypothetical protein